MGTRIPKFCGYGLFILLMFFSLSSCTGGSQVVSAGSKNRSNQNESNWEESVRELNEKITILQRWQQGYKMTAQQAQFKADRIQFQQENIVDSKRLWKVADNASQKAQDLQIIIDRLIQQRNTILRSHNQPIPKQKGYEDKSSIEEQEA